MMVHDLQRKVLDHLESTAPPWRERLITPLQLAKFGLPARWQ